MSPIAPLWNRYRLSGDHLLSAQVLADAASRVEAAAGPESWPAIEVEHLALVSGAILLSVAFLESGANEVFNGATAPMPFGLQRLDSNTVIRMQRLWDVSSSKRATVLEKYRLLLLLADAKEMDPGAEPVQSVQALIDVRNELVHYKAEWTETKHDGTGYPVKEHRLTRLLASRLVPVPFVPEADPRRHLSSACAQWAVTSTVEFAEEVLSRVGAFQPYTEIKAKLSQLRHGSTDSYCPCWQS